MPASLREAAFAACDTSRKCKTLEEEVKRLEDEAKQKAADAKAAHDELQKLSGLRTLTKQAAPISARIDELQRQQNEEKFVADTSSSSETGRTLQALLIALLIELGNRYGPEAIYKFLRQLGRREDDEPEHQAAPVPAPVPSIALPAVPHVAVAEPSANDPAPIPPSSRKRTVNKRKQASEPRPGNVIPFAKKPTPSEVLTLLSSGQTQREVASALGIGERTVKRIVALSKRGQMAPDLAAS